MIKHTADGIFIRSEGKDIPLEEAIKKYKHIENQFHNIKATLLVNFDKDCGRSRHLASIGKDAPVLTLLVQVLEQLVERSMSDKEMDVLKTIFGKIGTTLFADETRIDKPESMSSDEWTRFMKKVVT